MLIIKKKKNAGARALYVPYSCTGTETSNGWKVTSRGYGLGWLSIGSDWDEKKCKAEEAGSETVSVPWSFSCCWQRAACAWFVSVSRLFSWWLSHQTLQTSFPVGRYSHQLWPSYIASPCNNCDLIAWLLTPSLPWHPAPPLCCTA